MPRIALGDRVADRYLVLEELGGGGMGVVYRARDEQEGRDVALKVLRAEGGWEVARRLRREARATSAMDPKRVARVYDVGETSDGELYLVMEYVPGPTLRALLRRGRIARGEGIRILREVATTLGEAHRAGIVHRDVKPDNVLVSDGGRVVVVDFGIVKNVVSAEGAEHVSTELTSQGALLGTPAYLSPEQALGRGVGPEVDQFALAVTAFEVLTGSLPWRGTDFTGVLAQILSETPPCATSIDGTLSSAFDAVLARALSKEKSGRFPTIDAFGAALEAAERGIAPGPVSSPSPLSQTVDAPQSRPAALDAAHTAPASRSRWGAVALALVLLAGAGTGLVVAARSRVARSTPARSDPAAALESPAARIACPLFEVHGVAEIAGPLGAAAASFACERVKWYLGGRDDRILPAAALLDLPTQPVENFTDPYSGPDARARTLDLARARASAYLDGAVTRGPDGWKVVATVRASDGREIRRAEGGDPKELAVAVKNAITPLWSGPPLVPRPIDPEVARWTSFPDVDVGLAATDLLQLRFATDACDLLHRRVHEIGTAYYQFARACDGAGSELSDGGGPVLDESSPSALAISVRALIEQRVPISGEETRRLASEVDEMRARESSRFARGLLDDIAGRLWATANEPVRAHEALLAAIHEDPLLVEAWQELVYTSTAVGSRSSVSSVAAAWFPTQGAFLGELTSVRGDALPARLREAQLASILEPNLTHALQLGRALAESGRASEARALAAVSLGDDALDQSIQAYVLTMIDLHDARMAHASKGLLDLLGLGATDLSTVASVLGTTQDVGTKWATSFLAAPDARATRVVVGRIASIALCMVAPRDLAVRCLDRVEKIAHSTRNWWDQGGEELLAGAQRYARGDMRGAVAAWRPLVAGPTLDIARLLPTEAFERAGEPGLAARLDARKMAVTNLAGVSEAAPREARRAFASGDRARAKELAQQVVAAWEVADATVPAVAEMRALLKTID